MCKEIIKQVSRNWRYIFFGFPICYLVAYGYQFLAGAIVPNTREINVTNAIRFELTQGHFTQPESFVFSGNRVGPCNKYLLEEIRFNCMQFELKNGAERHISTILLSFAHYCDSNYFDSSPNLRGQTKDDCYAELGRHRVRLILSDQKYPNFIDFEF